MHRFFVAPAVFAQPVITLTGDQAHQVRRVLRMRPGERAILLDGRGRACEASLMAADAEGARFQVLRRWEAEGEPTTRITLYQAVLKGERFEWVLQKGTEVGVAAFVPLICERSIVDDPAALAAKRGRWERIIQEAAEQSGRGCLPILHPPRSFAQAISGTLAAPGSQAEDRHSGDHEVRLIFWEGEREARLRDVLSACNLAQSRHIQVFVGPEGGFSTAEIALARSHGIRPASLGPRILRAETAGVVAAALILYAANDI